MSKLSSELIEGYLVVHLPDFFTPAVLDQLELHCKNDWLLTPAEMIVFDFSASTEIPQSLYRSIVQFKQSLRAKQKDLCSIHLQEPLIKQISKDGMQTVFTPVQSLQDVQRTLLEKKPKPTLNIEFLNPFIQGTRVTLDVQAKTPVEIGKPVLKKQDTPSSKEFCIAAVLSLDAEAFQGSIVLSFPKSVFLKIYENMFGEKHNEISLEIQDAAGELLNIIFGIAKRELNDKKGFQIKKALPTVLTGQELDIPKTGQTKMIVQIPCTTANGVFHLEIHLAPGPNH